MQETSISNTILMVEDDLEDRLLIQEAIAEANIKSHFHFVTNGEEALSYLNKTGEFANMESIPLPYLIMLDLNMPRKNGLQALEEIRATEHLSQIPVIIFTTSQAEADKSKAYDLKANAFITKPTSFDELVNIFRYIHKTQYFFKRA